MLYHSDAGERSGTRIGKAVVLALLLVPCLLLVKKSSKRQPLYLWKQKKDKSWVAVPVDNASDELLTTGNNQFEFKYFLKIPQLNSSSSMWLPLPSLDDF